MVWSEPFERTALIRYRNETSGREELLPVSYFEEGNGHRTFIFLHGLGGSARDGLLLFRHMKKWRGRKISISLAGFGRTPPLAVDKNGIPSYVELVRLVMDALGITKAYLYGHSMGGATALAFGAKYPERALAIAAQGAPFYGREFPIWLFLVSRFFLRWSYWGPITFGWFEGTMKDVVRMHPNLVREVFRGLMTPDEELLSTPEVRMIGVADFLEASARAAAEAGESIMGMDLRPALREYKVPVLVLDGERPKNPTLRTAQDLMALLPRGMAKCYLFPQVGHMATILCPQDAVRVSLKFFRESKTMRPA